MFLLGLWILLVAVQRVSAARDVFPVEGHVVIPEGKTPLSRVRVLLHLNSGAEVVAFPKRDGSFVLHDVPSGTHTLDVDAIGFVYPQLRIDINGKRGGAMTAWHAADTRALMPDPLTLYPLTEAKYYEEKRPFNALSFVKSPMGMMAVFMVFAIFVLPKLKVDPDQYREIMAQTAPQIEAQMNQRATAGGGGQQRRKRD